MAELKLNPFSNTNIQQVSVSQQQSGLNPFGRSATNGEQNKSISDILTLKYGTPNSNSIYANGKITAPAEITTVQPQENLQSKGLAQKYSDGEISQSEAMEEILMRWDELESHQEAMALAQKNDKDYNSILQAYSGSNECPPRVYDGEVHKTEGLIA